MFNKRIEFFVVVVEEGSFSAAGRKLLLSQSAISQQITLLEKELGIILFNRTGYKPSLTGAGLHFYQGCVTLIKNFADLEEQTKSLSSHQELKIGITGPIENNHVPYIIKMYKEKYQMINISFLKGNFHYLVEMLKQGEVDVAFGIENDFKNKKDLQYQLLMPHHVCMICSYDHHFSKEKQIDIQQIIKEPIIAFSRNFGREFYNDFMEAFKKDGITPQIVKEVDTLDEMLLAVKLNEGIAFTSKEVIREEEVAVIDIANSHHQANYVIGYRKTELPLHIMDFITMTTKYFKRTL